MYTQNPITKKEMLEGACEALTPLRGVRYIWRKYKNILSFFCFLWSSGLLKSLFNLFGWRVKNYKTIFCNTVYGGPTTSLRSKYLTSHISDISAISRWQIFENFAAEMLADKSSKILRLEMLADKSSKILRLEMLEGMYRYLLRRDVYPTPHKQKVCFSFWCEARLTAFHKHFLTSETSLLVILPEEGRSKSPLNISFGDVKMSKRRC